MNLPPIEIEKLVYNYVPIGDLIDENTSKEYIEELFRLRKEEWDREGIPSVKYLYLPVRINKIYTYVMKVTILCNEYISHISTCTISRSVLEKTGEWDMKDIVKHKDYIYHLGVNHLTYGTGVKLDYDPSTNEMTVKSLASRIDTTVSLDDWDKYTRGGDDPRLNNIKRIQFLDYDILEFLLGDKSRGTAFYYGALDIFNYLYSKGYWTYGGFKNYVIDPDRKFKINREIQWTEDNTKFFSFTLSEDGTITGKVPEEISGFMKLLN